MKNILLLTLTFFLTSTVFSQVLVGVEHRGKMGYIDTTGKWVIQPQFEDADDFYHGYALIYKGDYEGLIDHTGEIVIKPKYDFMGYVEDGMIDIDHKDKIFYFNLEQRKMLPGKYEYGDEFEEGLAGVENKKGKYGVINKEGELIIPFKYDNVIYIDSGLIKVRLGEEKFFINQKDEIVERKIVYTNRKSLTEKQRITKIKDANPDHENLYLYKVSHRQGNVYWYKTSRDKFGLADTSGQLITEPIFEDLNYSSEGLAPAKKDGKYGFIYPNGEFAIAPKFEKVQLFSFGLAGAKLDGKWGFIDHKGEWKIQPIFDYITNGFRDVNTDRLLLYEYQYYQE